MDSRVFTNRSISLAHAMALKEDEHRDRMRKFYEANREMVEEFIAAIATDPSYAVKIADRAATILRRRDTMKEKKHV